MKKVYAKGSFEWQIFADYYKFCKDYGQPEQSDSYWESMKNDADRLVEKYAKSKYLTALVIAHMSEMERVFKAEKMANQ